MPKGVGCMSSAFFLQADLTPLELFFCLLPFLQGFPSDFVLSAIFDEIHRHHKNTVLECSWNLVIIVSKLG